MSEAGRVYPCYENQFSANGNNIAQCETFSVSIDGKTEEWYPMEQEGWIERMVTGKSITITVSGKRCVGDAGNDAIAALAYKVGKEAQLTSFEWNFPGGTLTLANAVVIVTNPGTGPSTNVAPFEFQILSNGKPTFE
ncbi:MAG: phage tail tube protein [Lachnospiraceae bacterium]